MAKSNESITDDDQDEDIVDRQEQEQDEAPKDVRGAIKAAFNEHRDEDDTDKDKDEPKPERAKSTPKRAKAEREDSEQGEIEDKESPREIKESKEVKEEIKIDPPPFFKNKGKATWEKLSPEDKQVIITREREVSDGFAQVSQRIRAFEEIERVIAPRLQTIQQYGVPPAQVVDRLFQWMENLQNPRTASQAFKDLAQGLGINVSQLAGQNSNTNTENEQTNSDGPPTWFSEYTQTVDQRLSRVDQIENQIKVQRETAAQNAVSNWAKDKPHYQQVAPLMGQLLQSGIVGLKEDGSVDLDGAYEKAIKLDPSVAALIQQEAAEKQAREASEKASKEAKEKAEKLTRAKRAGAGLKPAAPSGPAVQPNKGLNGKKDSSVRGSIRAALDEIREDA